MPLLSVTEVQQRLIHLPGWTLSPGGEIVREASFQDFIAAITFVNQVAARAEDLGHHPDIDIRYNKVRLALTSHDAGGLTEKDFEMAGGIEGILASGGKA
ncbi:MAG: 4a-hydroxytetrahydrobiopterin dehydratase [Acidobacteriaceae bacterium]